MVDSRMFLPITIVCLCVGGLIYYILPWLWGRYARKRLGDACTRRRMLVLTFDDGPGNRLTPKILDMMAAHGVKANFFLLGRNIAGREEILRRIAAEGHEICSHGFDHLHAWKVWPWQSISDIKQGWQAIDQSLGVRKGVYPFRPPYGKLNVFSWLYLLLKGIPIYYWTVVSGDTWEGDKRDSGMASRVLEEKGGAVVLAHDFDRSEGLVDKMVLESTECLLATAQKGSFRIVTMSELCRNN